MFERIISIDWCGAGVEAERVDLRVAVWDKESGICQIQLPSANSPTRSWSRTECRNYLRRALSEQKRTLVGMDFGFGLPWGSDKAIFQVTGWREMLRRIGQLYRASGTARATGQAINALGHLGGHGPYRFDENRTDFRFYLAHGVAYHRLTDLATPQAISQWYLGSGHAVGFHTITGLSALDWLIDLRERRELRFAVWPFEVVSESEHVLAETYPAICPKCEQDASCRGDDEHDAWKVLKMLVERNGNGSMAELFEVPEQRFGRISGIDFKTQIEFEGWILGLRNETK